MSADPELNGSTTTDEASVEQQLKDLRSKVDSLSNGLAYVREELDKRDETIEEQNAYIERLEQRVMDLEERTDLQQHIQDAGALDVEERAGVCVQTLVNRARKKQRNGGAPTASMDYNGADAALGGTLSREQLLRALRRAAEIIDGDAVRFISESRASQKNSRLVLDLEAGTLPSKAGGVELGAGTGRGR
jgi:chromosome segregation ATPase